MLKLTRVHGRLTSVTCTRPMPVWKVGPSSFAEPPSTVRTRLPKYLSSRRPPKEILSSVEPQQHGLAAQAVGALRCAVQNWLYSTESLRERVKSSLFW